VPINLLPRYGRVGFWESQTDARHFACERKWEGIKLKQFPKKRWQLEVRETSNGKWYRASAVNYNYPKTNPRICKKWL
jgi:hypothetical protein